MADNIHGASLDGIFERLTSVPSYHPLEAETFADWSLEAGDIVTVSRDGKSYPSPVHTAALTWRGQPEITVNSSGNEERDPVAKVSKKKYNRGSGGIRNNIGFYNDVWAEDGHVHSVISQTASEITAFVEDVYAQMVSGLQLTSSSAAMYVRDMYNQMTSGLALTSSSAAMYVHDMYNQLSSGLALTSSSAAIYVRDMYNQLASGLKLTSSTALLYVQDIYNQLVSGLKLTSSSAALYVQDMYRQLQSGLALTSSSAALYVQDMYRQMTSGLKLTSSSAAIYVRDMYRQMTAGLKITSSSITQYVTDSYNRMASGLYQTSSSLQATIVDAYNRLSSGLTLTNSAVRLYVNGRTTRAYIVAEINKGGSSEVRIGADQVQITGRTTLNDIMTISDNRVKINSPLQVVGNAMVESLTIRDGSSGSTLTQTNLAKLVGSSSEHGAVVSADLTNNKLTLTHMDGHTVEVTFKGAVSLSGSWSGTTYTVSAVSGTITGTPPSTTVFLEIEPALSVAPNNVMIAKIYEGAPNTQTGSVRTSTYLRLEENVNGQYVEAYTGSGNTKVQKGYISTTQTYKAGGVLSESWTNGTLKVTSAGSGSFTSQISATLTVPGSSAGTRFEAHARSTDDLGTFQSRAHVSGYLKENVNGTNSTAYVTLDPDSTSAIAVISTKNTYNAGYNAGHSAGYSITSGEIGVAIAARVYSAQTSVTGRENAGGISAAAIQSYVNGHILFSISCRGTNRHFYITINP